MAWNDVNGATVKFLHKITCGGRQLLVFETLSFSSQLHTHTNNLYAIIQATFTIVCCHPFLISILEALQQPAHKYKETSGTLFLFSQSKMEV